MNRSGGMVAKGAAMGWRSALTRSLAFSATSRWLSPGITKRTKPRCTMTIHDTALGDKAAGSALLDGLDVFTVPAIEDDHPLSVYGLEASDPDESPSVDNPKPILLLHGRTWSSVPVYHLLGGKKQREKGGGSRSLMEALHANGLYPYAMDFRGFGGTPPDPSNTVEPLQCVRDVESVLRWITERHGLKSADSSGNIDPPGNEAHVGKCDMPALLGWSQGALIAQLVAQNNATQLSKLILYGSIYDPLVRYPRDPLYTTSAGQSPLRIENTFDMAVEDFTVEGSIPPETATRFAEAALQSDPLKAVWSHQYQFNNCDPARVHVPTLVVSYIQTSPNWDPYWLGCFDLLCFDLMIRLGWMSFE